MSDEKPVKVLVKDQYRYRGSINQVFKYDRNDDAEISIDEVKPNYDIKIQNEEKLTQLIPGLEKDESEKNGTKDENQDNADTTMIKTKHWI